MDMNKGVQHRGTERTEASCIPLRVLCASVFQQSGFSASNKPIGVSEYTITQNLPEQLRSSLPSIEEIEAELGDWEVE